MTNPVYGIDDLRLEIDRLQEENENLRTTYADLATSYAQLAKLGSRPPIMLPQDLETKMPLPPGRVMGPNTAGGD